jgi:hypothetical protein
MHKLLRFFTYRHLPDHLSEQFCELAHEMADTLPENPESTTALRRLEAKGCAARAVLFKG